MASRFGVDGGVRCSECAREVDEFTTIAERWLYYSDGRDLYPYCPPYAKREFAEGAPAMGRTAPGGHNPAESAM